MTKSVIGCSYWPRKYLLLTHLFMISLKYTQKKKKRSYQDLTIRSALGRSEEILLPPEPVSFCPDTQKPHLSLTILHQISLSHRDILSSMYFFTLQTAGCWPSKLPPWWLPVLCSQTSTRGRTAPAPRGWDRVSSGRQPLPSTRPSSC